MYISLPECTYHICIVDTVKHSQNTVLISYFMIIYSCPGQSDPNKQFTDFEQPHLHLTFNKTQVLQSTSIATKNRSVEDVEQVSIFKR